jgi:carbon storage regulator
MLVLTRKTGQIINIGDDIRIKIVEVGNGIVKLGIEAPRELPIFREELYEKLKQLNKESAKMDMERIKHFLGEQ